jgi:hypothetical protein
MLYTPNNFLTGTGSPVGVVTPLYLNQYYMNLTGYVLWQANGPTSANWVQLGSSGIVLGNALEVIDGNSANTINATIAAYGTNGFGPSVTMTTAGTAYNINSIVLPGAGTYVVTGRVMTTANTGQSGYLNLASAVAANSWIVVTTSPAVNINEISATITVARFTTIYLNETAVLAAVIGQGVINATQVL